MAKARTPMRVWFALVAILTLLFGTERFAAGQSLTWRVTTSDVVLLSRPAATSPIAATARAGTTLQVIGSNGDWFQVSVVQANGAKPSGWMRAKDFRLTTPSSRPPDATTAKAETTPAPVAPAKPAAKPATQPAPA